MREQAEALKRNMEEKSEVALEETAIDMEVASQKLYERLLRECDNPAEKKIYEEIIADEEDHERKMKKIKAKEY
jgi:rubrerythrin